MGEWMQDAAFPFLVAMGAPPKGRQPWVSFVPFALVLGIFYFVILLPMKRSSRRWTRFSRAEGGRPRRHLRRHLRHITGITEQACSCRSPRRSASRSRGPRLSASRDRIPSPPKASHDRTFSWRTRGIILAVIALSVTSFYPPKDKVNLGLDLKGGVHLVLRVQTDDALRLETETTAERLRDTLTRGTIQFTKLEIKARDLRRSRASTNDQAFRTAAVDAGHGLQPVVGVGGYTYTMKPNIENQLRGEAVTQALQTIERRVNELGVAEPIVARQGAVDQILVELPGVSDVQRAKDIIRSTALLELKIVEQGPFGTRGAARAGVQQRRAARHRSCCPAPRVRRPAAPPAPCTTSVRRVVGRHRPRPAQRPADARREQSAGRRLLAQPEGARKFGTATEQNIGRQLAIVLDGRVTSAPTIQSRISDEGQISGSFTQQEAQDLSLSCARARCRRR